MVSLVPSNFELCEKISNNTVIMVLDLSTLGVEVGVRIAIRICPILHMVAVVVVHNGVDAAL
jgi:hypothetical protein